MRISTVVIGLCLTLLGAKDVFACEVTPSFTLSATTYCGSFPTTVGITNTSTGPESATATYRWYRNGTLVATTVGLAAPPDVVIASAGAYTIRLEAEDAAACVDDTDRSFTARQRPTASFSFPAGPLCGSNRVQFTNTSTNTVGGVTYAWNFGHPGGTSNQQNPNHKFPNGGGTFNVTLTVTNPGGCSDVISQTVTIGNAPTADFLGSGSGPQGTEFCLGAADPSTTIDVSFFNTTVDAVSYLWDFGDGNSSTAFEPTHTYTATGTFPVTLTATGSGGCTDTRTYNVLYAKAPTGTFSFDATGTSGCPPLTVAVTQLNNVSTLSNFNYRLRATSTTGPVVFSYDTNSPTDLPSFNLVAPGEYYLELSASTACGSVNALHRRSAFFGPIIVANTPIANFNFTLAGTTQEGTTPGNYLGRGCATNRITFTNSSQFAEPSLTNHKWFFDRNPTDSILGTRTPAPQLFGQGTYNVKLISGNSCGTDTIVRQIVIDSISVPLFDIIDPVGCVNAAGNYTVRLNNNSLDGGNTTYEWRRSNYCYWGWPHFSSGFHSQCEMVSAGPAEPNATFRTFASLSNTATTTYWVRLTITNGCGVRSLQQNVTVHPLVDSRPRVNGGTGPVQICEGQSVTFTDASYGTPLAGPSMQYQWDFANGNTAAVGGSHSQAYATQGTYWAKLRVTGFCGTDLDSVQVIVKPYPVAVIDVPDPDTVCQTTGTLGFNGSNSSITTPTPIAGPTLTYSWNFGAGATPATSTAANPTGISWSTAGVKTITLTVTQNGCTDVTTRTITANPLPTPSFTRTPTANTCSPAVLSYTNTTNLAAAANDGATFSWDLGDGTTFTGLTPPAHTYTHNGNTFRDFSVNLTATNRHGCTQTTPTQTVRVLPQPVADFTVVPTTGCQNLGVAITNNSTPAAIVAPTNLLTYSWNFGAGAIRTDNSAPITTFTGYTPPGITYTTPGTRNITLTISQRIQIGGVNQSTCESTQTIPVTVHPRPAVNFTATPTDSCAPMTVRLTNLVAQDPLFTYLWDFGDGTTSTAWDGGGTHTYTNTGTTVLTRTLKLVVTTDQGCKDSLQRTITVRPLPVADFTALPTNGCQDLEVTMVNNSIPANDPTVTYSWSFDTGAVFAGTGLPAATFTGFSPPNIIYRTPGAKTIRLRVIQSGCADSMDVALTVIPKDTARFTVTPTSGCSPMAVAITNTTTPNANLTYFWDFGDGNTFAGANPAAHTYTNTGATSMTYTLKLRVTNTLTTCSDSLIIPVTVSPSPQANIVAVPDSGCQELRVDFLNNSIPAFDPGSFYEWDFGDGAIYTGSGLPATTLPSYIAPSITYLTPGLKTIRFMLRTNGCPDTMRINVRVVPKDTARFTVDRTTGCTPMTVNLTNTTTPNAALTYFWDFGDGNTFVGANPGNHTYTNPGVSPIVRNLKLRVINGTSGCPDSLIIPITIDPSPTAVLPALSDACAFTDYTLPNSSINAVSHSWDFGDGSPLGSGSNPVHRFRNNTGVNQTYTVKLVVTNAQGCKDSTTRNILVLPRPTARYSANTVCEGNATTFTDASTGAVSYSWDFGDGSPLNTTVGTVQYTYPSAGLYTTRLQVTGANGCLHDTLIQVRVERAPVVMFNSNIACEGQTTVFTDQTTNLPGVNFPVSWLWDFADGNTSTAQNPTHLFTASGTYNVKLVVQNNTGCRDSVTRAVVIAPKPVSSFTFGLGCSGKPTTFVGQQAGPGTFTYLWNFGDGSPLSTLPNPTHIFVNPGTYNVRLTTGFAGGCTDDTVISVTVIRSPQANFSLPAGPVCFRQMATFTNSSVAHGTTNTIVRYAWDFGDGNTSTAVSPTHLYGAAGTYSVQLVVENAEGCTDTLRRNMLIRALPTPNFIATRVCLGQTTQFTNTSVDGVSYTWQFGSGGATSTAVNPSFVYPDTGTYQVTLRAVHASGCDSSITLPVRVDSLPRANFSVANVCSTEAAVFTDASQGAPVRWDWNFGNGDTRTLTAVPNGTTSYQYLVPGTYTVTLVVTNQHGCTNTTNRSVTIHPVPTANFSSGLVCATDSTPFTDLSLPNSVTRPIVDWEWDFGDGSPVYRGTTAQHRNPKHVYTVGGNYSVQLVVFNDRGCSDTLRLNTVTVDFRPTANFTFGAVCLGDSVQFTNTSVANAAGPIDYFWDFGDGNNSVSSNPRYAFKALGPWNVKLIATNRASGCRDSLTQIVTLRNTALASWTSSPVCHGTPTAFQNRTPFLNTPAENAYLWTFGPQTTPLTSTLRDPSVVFPTPGDRTVLLRVTDANGCVSFFDTIVNVLPIPNVSFTVTSPLPAACTNNTLNFSYTGTTSAFNTNYIWDFGDGNIQTGANLTNVTHSYANQQTYTVTLYVENALGCSANASQAVTVSQNIVPDFSFASGCAGAPVTFTNLSTAPAGGGPLTYNWNMGDGTTFGSAGNANHVFAAAGTYNVTLTVRNFQGCEAVITKAVPITDQPDAAFDFTTACAGEPTQFTDRTLSSPAHTTWFWDFGDGNTSTLPNPEHRYTNPGAYLVRLDVSNGCLATEFRAVLVEQNVIAAFDIAPDDSICDGDVVRITGRSSNNAVWEDWDMGDGTPIVRRPAGTAFSYTYAAPRRNRYTIRLFTQGTNCSAQITRFLDVIPDIPANFTTERRCVNAPVQFVNLTPDLPGALYLWDFGDGRGNAAVRNPVYQYLTPGTYNTRLLVLFDDRSCEAEVTLPVEIPTLPTAAFDILDRQLLLPRDPVEVVYTGQDAVQLVWSWGDGQQTVVNTNLRSLVSHTYADQGTYLITLTATDINGCVVTDTGSVATFRSNEIVVPTAFSPNGDNVNETWRGYTPFRFENYLLQVFNRWGRVIFETRDEFEEWDGRYNGQPVQQDAYVWKITAIDDKGLVKELVGTVTVVR